jgi:N-acetyltransferase
MDSWITAPLTLQGRKVRLESLAEHHLDRLWEQAQEPTIWTWMPERIESRSHLSKLFEHSCAMRDRGLLFPFVIFDVQTSECAGSSSYLNMDRKNMRVEIGGTWLAPRWQRTHINTEAKWLLLNHAFDQMKCVRVEFKTDALNSRSRAALKRIGAVEEGCLRRHMVTHDGRIRDSIYFSILDSEWPQVATALTNNALS